jgi:hypothetical protein
VQAIGIKEAEPTPVVLIPDPRENLLQQDGITITGIDADI